MGREGPAVDPRQIAQHGGIGGAVEIDRVHLFFLADANRQEAHCTTIFPFMPKALCMKCVQRSL